MGHLLGHIEGQEWTGGIAAGGAWGDIPGIIPSNIISTDFGIKTNILPLVIDIPQDQPPGGGGGGRQLSPLLGLALAALAGIAGKFGWELMGKAAIGLFGINKLMEWAGVVVQTILPGLQGEEFPPGLGSIQGRPVKRWIAGGQKVYFAQFEQPTRRGSHLQNYVWQAKRQAWVPYRQRRNIVIGAKELSLAAALGHKRKLGKRRVLQNIAGHFGGHPRHLRAGGK